MIKKILHWIFGTKCECKCACDKIEIKKDFRKKNLVAPKKKISTKKAK